MVFYVRCSFWKLPLLGALSFVRSPCWILCFSKILIMVLSVWNVDDLDAGGELDKMIVLFNGIVGFGDVIQFAPANMFFWDGYWVHFGPVIVLAFFGLPSMLHCSGDPIQ
ncbi:hypothetical protein OPV22_004926 [Ensete ventricosum]|uniref:Uncharacterized protein n=1 Tax=Ensete ventricosum TaxID=4639 RepID=A0AAV8RBQ2_ENSVE|nr:hypothetical protein OPV22_004926 [Ensete ventricosum]